MFGGYEMFLVVWLTHPGVVLDIWKGFPVISALWQCMWLQFLYFSIKKESAAITMSILYSIFTAVWMYFVARQSFMTLTKSVS